MFLTKEFDHLQIQLEDIRSATDDFGPTKLIGRGRFGPVYKGELCRPEGRTAVAFKRLDRKLGQGNTEFWKEIMMLSKLKHENLISLLHFCIDGDDRILVYEYASRGSLDRYISDASLTWIQRLQICIQAARGINHLHDPKETQQRVIHRDIKSSNILLDENWTAKVSDFGLSKFGLANQPETYMVSNAVGTIGYCDPLYHETGFLTKESDVYSFGVVLFEAICGKLCCEYRNNQLLCILVHTWKNAFDEEKVDDIIFDPLKGQIDAHCLKTFSTIAYQCLNRDHKERPVMAEIINELEVALEQQLKSSKDNVDCGQLILKMLKAKIDKITFQGGLVNEEGVKELIQLMEHETAENNKIDLACRIMLLNVISSTERSEYIQMFVQFRGLDILDDWLSAFYKRKNSDKSVEEFLFALLHSLDKFPVIRLFDHDLEEGNIRMYAYHLSLNAENPEIQKEATSLVNKCDKLVTEEMPFIESWPLPDPYRSIVRDYVSYVFESQRKTTRFF